MSDDITVDTSTPPGPRPTDKRYSSIQFRFEYYRQELTFELPQLDGDVLLNFHLRLYTTPTPSRALDSPGPVCPKDIRVYLNEHDLTESIVALLKDMLDANEAVCRPAYVTALEKWLEMLAAYDTALELGVDLAAERLRATELSTAAPLSSVIDELGSRTNFGFGGNLHIFNHLYRSVPVDNIDFGTVIEHFNAAGNGPIDIRKLSEFRLTFSHGESHKIDGIIESPVDLGGELFADLTCEFNNPLNEVIDDLYKRIQALWLELEYLADEVLPVVERIDQTFYSDDSTTPHGEPVRSVIKHYLVPIDNELTRLTSELNTWRTRLTSHSSSVDDLERKVEELKQAVESL